MKKQLFRSQEKNGRIIQVFGGCELVKTAEGFYELRGGSNEDRMGALEWISLFMHHAAPRIVK